jgi:uncharacterized RDD family membrane protein YckC
LARHEGFGQGPGRWPVAGAWPPGPAQAPGGAWPPGPAPTPATFGPGPYPGWGTGPGWGGYGYFAPPPGPLPGLAWGGLGHRFAALLLDGALMFGTLIVAGLVAGFFADPNPYDDVREYSTASAIVSLAWMLMAVCYHPACWYFFGGTVGQRAMGLRVVRAADGRKLGLGAILVRFAIFAICTVTIIPGLIAAATAADDPFKRAWHDEAARSVVVRRLW